MNLLNMWSTPILQGTIDNKDIINSIVSYIFENYDLDNLPSDLNGTDILKDINFKPFLDNIVEPAFDRWLKKVLNRSVYDFDYRRYKGWVAGTRVGYSMPSHNHTGSQLAGVFYLLTDNTDSGKITFFDPKGNANRGYPVEDWGPLFSPLTVDADSGTFVIFPSYLYHQVSYFKGKTRVAIPVDLFL